MKQFLLDEQLAAAVLNYLAARPYGEVFPLIQRLQALPLHEPPAMALVEPDDGRVMDIITGKSVPQPPRGKRPA